MRAALQVAATFVIAALSWRYVEEPIRHGALGRLWAQARTVRWQPADAPPRGAPSLAAAVVLLVLTSLALAGVKPPAISSSGSGGSTDLSANAGAVGSAAPAQVAHGGGSGAWRSRRSAASGSGGGLEHAHGMEASGSDPPHKGPLRTSCKSVVHIGDSTSEGLISADYLPDPKQRIPAQYARVGATTQHMEITGATSIVETLPGGMNAYEGRPGACPERIQGLLGDRAGHQRHRRRVRRVLGQPERADQGDDVGDRQPAGPVGQRQVAVVAAARTPSPT